jgi:hypothetical protein
VWRFGKSRLPIEAIMNEMQWCVHFAGNRTMDPSTFKKYQAVYDVLQKLVLRTHLNQPESVLYVSDYDYRNRRKAMSHADALFIENLDSYIEQIRWAIHHKEPESIRMILRDSRWIPTSEAFHFGTPAFQERMIKLYRLVIEAGLSDRALLKACVPLVPDPHRMLHLQEAFELKTHMLAFAFERSPTLAKELAAVFGEDCVRRAREWIERHSHWFSDPKGMTNQMTSSMALPCACSPRTSACLPAVV